MVNHLHFDISLTNNLTNYFCMANGRNDCSDKINVTYLLCHLSVQADPPSLRRWPNGPISTLSSLNLPLSSSSTTNRELLSQFSTCSEWRRLAVGENLKKNCHVLVNQFHGNFPITLGCGKIKSALRDVKWCFNASWGLKGLSQHCVSVCKVYKAWR